MPKKIEQYSSDEDSSDVSDVELSHTEGSDSDDGSDGGSADDREKEEEEQRAALRKQLEDVPFDKLIRMRQKAAAGKAKVGHLGEKDKARLKAEARRALRRRLGKDSEESDNGVTGGGGARGSGSSEDDFDGSAPEMASAGGSSQQQQRSGKAVDLHRESRKMPTVMSSKRPVGRFRQVVDMPQGKTRDPRFDGLSGHLNEDLFEKSYGFLEEQRKQEMADLKVQARVLKDRNPREAAKARRALETMQSQDSAQQQKKRVQELKRKHRKMEMEAVKQGKTPYFLGQRELKELEAAQKFGSLSNAKLDRFLEKRRKRNAAKDHRRMPFQRRDE
ncbi:rRNA biogenesis protein rrp36 [Coemansia biformis]|uniref:rRNA biogenesis protein RRP36 n=1 Tax=Coemansia biformis TaxID=1286918 RepID=A0A9W8CWG8_9FUNG|nr:rRNA biogenesis protein rrp36 [Coemansia biformis]